MRRGLPEQACRQQPCRPLADGAVGRTTLLLTRRSPFSWSTVIEKGFLLIAHETEISQSISVERLTSKPVSPLRWDRTHGRSVAA